MKKPFLISFCCACIALLVQVSVYAQNNPRRGELIITEFMANPSAVSDTKGEWFEIYNASSTDLLLNGLIISDSGSNKHTLTSNEDVILPAGQFFLLAKSGDPEENGGLSPDYVYSNFTLGNSEDEIILSLEDESILDEITYNSEWPIFSGASLELNPSMEDAEINNIPANWHPAVEIYGDGDLGTPKLTNSILNGIFTTDQIMSFEVFPNPTKGELYIRFSTSSEGMANMYILDILGRKHPLAPERINQSTMMTLDLTGIENGLYWLVALIGKQKYTHKLIKY